MISLAERMRRIHRRYHWSKAGCIFVHVPKAAGTSINHAIYGRTLGHYSIAEIRKFCPQLAKSCFVFSIARNPIDRLFSAYRFAKIGKTNDMGMQNPAQYQIPEFQSFDRFIHQWLVHQDLATVDFVFRPQSRFLCVDDQLAVDFLGHVETIADDLEAVSDILKRNIRLPQLNRNQSGNLSDNSKFVSDDSKNVIFKLFRQDFELLGYANLLPENEIK